MPPEVRRQIEALARAALDVEEADGAELRLEVVREGRRARIDAQDAADGVDRLDVTVAVDHHVRTGLGEQALERGGDGEARRHLGNGQRVGDADLQASELERPARAQQRMIRLYRAPAAAVVAVAARDVDRRHARQLVDDAHFVDVAGVEDADRRR